jgi:mono/diheme cytochrome c family protein
MRPLVASASLVLAVSSCDNSEAFRKMNPSWSRMLTQPRADAYDPSEVFDNGKVMQDPPRGTIPADLEPSEPLPITRELVVLGRTSFETYCAACHGILGDGQSVVAEKMLLRPPPSFHEARIRAFPPATIVQVIESGYGFMPSYAVMVRPHERWAVAAYVKALQASRMPASELPPDLRDALEKSDKQNAPSSKETP